MVQHDGSNGTLKKIVLGVAITVTATALIAAVSDRIWLAGWQGRVDTEVDGLKRISKQIEEVRTQLDILRGQLSATRTEILHAIDLATEDRFKGADWEKQKEIINIRFDTFTEKIERLQKSIDGLKEEIRKK